jgi:hypothetical protein
MMTTHIFLLLFSPSFSYSSLSLFFDLRVLCHRNSARLPTSAFWHAANFATVIGLYLCFDKPRASLLSAVVNLCYVVLCGDAGYCLYLHNSVQGCNIWQSKYFFKLKCSRRFVGKKQFLDVRLNLDRIFLLLFFGSHKVLK